VNVGQASLEALRPQDGPVQATVVCKSPSFTCRAIGEPA